MNFNRVVCLTVMGVAAFSFCGMADTLNVGFELPYTVGNIKGQQGWSNAGNYDAAVTSAAAYQGTQSLRISNGIATGSFGDQTFTPHLTQAAGETSVGPDQNFFSSWYFKSVTGALQDGLGISVSPDNGAGARMSYVRMQDDSTNGMNLLFYDTTSTGAFVPDEIATNLNRNVWHRVDLNIQFVDGPSNDIVQVFLDGSLIKTGTTWEDFQRYGPIGDGGGGGLAPVNSLLFRAGGDPVSSTLGKGFYIDNVSIESTPEPGTVGLLLAGFGGLIALAKRRRILG